MRKGDLGCLLILALVIGALVWSCDVVPDFLLHRHIALEDVAAVSLTASDTFPAPSVPVPPEEARQIIAWFNRATHIRNNPDHNGSGCGYSIEVVIELKSGQKVNIAPGLRAWQGKHDYFFAQPDLERYLIEAKERLPKVHHC